METNLTIKTWAEEDRPREKLKLKGKSMLSDAELLAIILGSGTGNETAVDLSKRLLKQAAGNNLGKLARLQVSDLVRFKGIGEAKAISIIAALELGRRRQDSPEHEIFKVNSSLAAYRILKTFLTDLSHEEFHVLHLNRANHFIGKSLISKGGITGTVADPRLIFRYALDHLSTGIILCHNHPSGNLTPSEQDIKLTKKMVEAGKILEIPVLDHIIVTDKTYFSFADEGLMP